LTAAFPGPPLRVLSLAIFGGTFDPVHRGHLTAARAARDLFHLDAVHFVVAASPPHKRRSPLSPYPHRCAMVALACSDHADFRPSLAEAPAEGAPPHAFYTIDTVRLAVLAALNIADEYHLLKRKQDSGATDYQKRAHLLADALDEVLDEKRKAG